MEPLEDRWLLSGNLPVAFQVDGDWGSGFQGQIRLTNPDAEALRDWKLEFDLDRDITSLWNARMLAHAGNHYVVAGPAWGPDLAAGATASFGFIATPGGDVEPPTGWKLNGTLLGGDPAVLPAIDLAGPTVREGDSGSALATFTLTLSAVSPQMVEVRFATRDGSAVAGSDYQTVSGSLTFQPGETEKTVEVSIVGDTEREADERFFLTLLAPSGATLATSEAAATVVNNDVGDETEPSKRVVAYYTEWSTYARNYQVMDIPADQLTTLIYAFADISAQGEVQVYDSYAALDKAFPGDTWDQPLRGNIHQLQKLQEQYPHLETLIAVGGWTLSGRFSDVALTEASRQRFAASAVRFVTQYGFDGIDLDWEYPGGGGLASNTVRPEDGSNYTLLVQELRRQFDLQEAIDGQDYRITVAGPAGFDKMANFELAEMATFIDWFDVMTYDYHGAWENQTNHNAPLQANPADPSSFGGRYNTDWTIQAYLEAGVPARQINLGVPLYGRTWSGVASTQHGLFQPAAGPGSGSWEPGVIDYKDLHERLSVRSGTYTLYRDEAAGVPFVHAPSVDNGFFSTHEDPVSLQRKADYARTHDLGGLFFWDLSSDLPPTDPDSLVALAHREMTGGTDNPVSLPRLTVGDARVSEGDQDGTQLAFTVRLSAPSSQAVSVDYATSDGTALAGSDYQAAQGTLDFAPGELEKTLNINVRGDTSVEADETLRLDLVRPVNATMAASAAIGLIVNDDQDLTNTGFRFRVVSDWGSGFTGEIELTNSGTSPIANWVVEFDWDRQIDSIWDARVLSHTGHHCVIGNAGWNGVLAPGASVRFGFTGRAGEVTFGPSNWVLRMG